MRSAEMFVGVDGCRAGWLCVSKINRTFDAWISPDISAAFSRANPRALFGIDIPIGLAASGPRSCDQQARQFLGMPRCCSVFSPPARRALLATTHAEACQIQRAIDGRGISLQAFGLFPKLKEVDTFLRANPSAATRTVEIHPEVSFAKWRGEPMRYGKKTKQGRAERSAVIESEWPGLIDRLHSILPNGYANDDLLDAVAALWSTIRHARQRSDTSPSKVERDEYGLAMQIVS